MDVIFLDFAKAFDKVPNKKLLKKLNGHEIQCKLFEWIKSWLNNRIQRVVLSGRSSSWRRY